MTIAVRYADPEEMIAWCGMRIGCVFRSDARAIGLVSDQHLIAVTVFDTFSPRDCNLSVAARAGAPWLTRTYLRHVVTYPFVQCALPRVSCYIDADNAASIRFAEHCGARREGRLRGAARNGGDQLIYGLLRSECRWVPRMLGAVLAKAAA